MFVSPNPICCLWVWYQTEKLPANLYLLDDASVYDGAPVGLQIIGRRFEEEKVLALAKIISEALCNENRDTAQDRR